jgi:hypothetical protein
MRFNFLDWMSMNMAVDIAFLIFTIAFVWKLRSVMKYAENLSLQMLQIKQALEAEIEKNKNHLTNKIDAKTGDLMRVSKVQANDMFVLKTMIEKNEFRIQKNEDASKQIKKDLVLTQKNPQAARRRLKEK